MGFDTERGNAAVLDDAECWQLLEARELGRLAVSVADRPDIYPITYRAYEGRVYFRTAQGSKLLELTINGHVALEIDDVGADSAVSVVLHGTARQLDDDEEIAAVSQLSLRPRVGDDKPVYVEITPEAVTGRRFVLPGDAER